MGGTSRALGHGGSGERAAVRSAPAGSRARGRELRLGIEVTQEERGGPGDAARPRPGGNVSAARPASCRRAGEPRARVPA